MVARVREAANGYLSVPFANDVELSMRYGPAALGTELRQNALTG